MTYRTIPLALTLVFLGTGIQLVFLWISWFADDLHQKTKQHVLQNLQYIQTKIWFQVVQIVGKPIVSFFST